MLKRNKFTKAGALLLMVATILSISLVSRWTKASETHTATHDTITTAVATDAHGAEHATAEHAEGEKKFNPGDMIFEHILDAHDWHLWGEGHSAVSIPLPVIVYSSQRGLACFMSSHFHHGHKTYNGYMLHKGPNEKKASIVAVNEMEETDAHAATINQEATAGLWDISITKNVVSLIISCIILLWIMLSVAKLYVQRKDMAPKGIQSLLEPVIIMIREDVAKASIGPKYEKFMPYLLTVFFFIFLSFIFRI